VLAKAYPATPWEFSAHRGQNIGDPRVEPHFQELSPPLATGPWHTWKASSADGLDGVAVRELLKGAVMRGYDPLEILRRADIDTSVYGCTSAAIDGQALVRLMRQIQITLDDVYLGFLEQGCRLALEAERIMCLLHADTLGEALRVSVRFTDAMAPDVGPFLSDENGAGLRHTCRYNTIYDLDRDILVWIRFVWIYHFFSWLIGRPLMLRGLLVRGARPEQENGFDRFALFPCPIRFNAPVDALLYDSNDLSARLLHSSNTEYNAYYANSPDWFASHDRGPRWGERTQQAIVEFQREGLWSPTIQTVAKRLNASARRLRVALSAEGESYREMRTRLRGELAGAYLVASDISIQEIGMLLGFSEPGSFSRHFFSWAGISPTAYRARHAANPAKTAAATALLNVRRVVRHA